MMATMEASGMWLFTNLLYKIGICKSEGGPLCGPINCAGPLHPPSCSSSGGSGGSGSGSSSSNGSDADESYTEDASYEVADEADWTNSESGGLPSASSRWSLLPLIIAAGIGTMFLGLYMWKKRVSDFCNSP